jgi:putative hydrolase of the HAD superfamily
VSSTPSRAVLFDLDDTLYEYTPCDEAGLAAAHAMLTTTSPLDFEAFREMHDRARNELAIRLRGQAASHNRAIFFKLVVEQHTGTFQGALALEMFASYWSAFLARMTPAPGAEEVLAELSRSYALALVTNHTTDIQLRKIGRLGLDRWFPVVVTSEEVGAEKPDARAFAAALEALGVEASHAVMVGDNPEVDALGAARAGLRTVLSTEFRRRPAEKTDANLVVRSVREVPTAVRELIGAPT